jgi:hypothetical protein
VRNGHEDVAKFLIEHGAAVDSNALLAGQYSLGL